MIIKLQSIAFVMFGFLCWHGVDDAIRVARQDAQIELLVKMPLEALIKIEVRDV